MKTYKVIVRKCGEFLADVTVSAHNALDACQKAEAILKVNPQRCQISEGKNIRAVFWSGLDTEARVFFIP